jgi:hypothetical protein
MKPNRTPFAISIQSSSNGALHVVKVREGNETIGELLFKGRKIVESVVRDQGRLRRFREAALSLIDMGACGGNFDF